MPADHAVEFRSNGVPRRVADLMTGAALHEDLFAQCRIAGRGDRCRIVGHRGTEEGEQESGSAEQ